MPHFKKILVATDFSETSELALTYGAEMAVKFCAQLIIVHVDPGLATLSAGVSPFMIQAVRGLAAEQRTLAGRELEALAARLRFEYGTDTKALLVSGVPYLQILNTAKSHGVEVLVMGTHGRSGFSHALLGSVAERVIRLAFCPVLTVRHPLKAGKQHAADSLQRTAHPR